MSFQISIILKQLNAVMFFSTLLREQVVQLIKFKINYNHSLTELSPKPNLNFDYTILYVLYFFMQINKKN